MNQFKFDEIDEEILTNAVDSAVTLSMEVFDTKSFISYEITHRHFEYWVKTKTILQIDENALIAYFDEHKKIWPANVMCNR